MMMMMTMIIIIMEKEEKGKTGADHFTSKKSIPPLLTFLLSFPSHNLDNFIFLLMLAGKKRRRGESSGKNVNRKEGILCKKNWNPIKGTCDADHNHANMARSKKEREGFGGDKCYSPI